MTGDKSLHVLHLARWYPSQDDPMLGLFIRNQLKALPGNVSNTVIFTWPVQGAKEVRRELTEEGLIKAICIFYPSRRFSLFNFFVLLKLTYKEAMAVNAARPVDLIHAHILTRMAFTAKLLGMQLSLPYVVSEHWSRYYPQNPIFKGYFRILQSIKAVKRAEALICVSESLRDAMKRFSLEHPKTHIIPTVVDTSIFKPVDGMQQNDGLRLVHISCFEEKSKNIAALLKALAMVTSKGKSCHTTFIGDGPDRNDLMKLAAQLGLTDQRVHFAGQLSQEAVADAMPSFDYLIQTSHYETFSTVVIEAWACGVPVMSTEVGVFAGFKSEKLGRLISSCSAEDIAAVIMVAARERHVYDKQFLRQYACDNFSSERVGALLYGVYSGVLARTAS